MNSPALLLASGSPRRRELLSRLGVPFQVVTSGFDEESVPTDGLTPAQWTMRLAEGKARAAAFPFSPPAPNSGGVGITPAPPELALASGDAARAAGASLPYVVLGADTTVTLDGAYFNKPADKGDARRMLRLLSGQTHTVTTGLCVLDTRTGQARTAFDAARVAFDPMTDAQIDAYIATGDPMDKAGAYGVQGGLLPFTPRVDGDFYTVMGLPVRLTHTLLLPFFPTLKPIT